MRVKNVLIIVMQLLVSYASGQQLAKSLNVGDSLPIFNIPKIIDGTKRKTLNTAAYRNKLLIIDFWSTNCGGCVAALPEMVRLQKKIGNNIMILPVTFEKEAHTLEFLSKNKYTRNIKIFSVVEDTIFKNYFKHKYIPHEVWVYRGKVIGITEPEYVDEYNIRQVLNGKRNTWPIKNDFYTFDHNEPLVDLNINRLQGSPIATQYTVISHAIKKYSSSLLPGRSEIIRDSSKRNIRFYLLNQSILGAYTSCWSNLVTPIKPSMLAQNNDIIWEVADRSRYIYEKSYGYRQDWMQKNAICFESVHPDNGQSNQDIYRSVIADLNSILGLNVRWEKRNERVLVIVRGRIPLYKLKSKSTKGEKYLIDDLVYNLNREEGNPYVFNESNDTETQISLEVSSWKDLDLIRKGLHMYGFEILETNREVDKLVFSEISKNRIDNMLVK